MSHNYKETKMQPNQNVYSVKDIKSELFANPFIQENNAVAIRNFGTACEDEKSKLNKYPEDFVLHHIGTYNFTSGAIEPSNPSAISTASEFVTQTTPTIVPPKSMYDKNLI